jgi:hypothetical protein
VHTDAREDSVRRACGTCADQAARDSQRSYRVLEIALIHLSEMRSACAPARARHFPSPPRRRHATTFTPRASEVCDCEAIPWSSSARFRCSTDIFICASDACPLDDRYAKSLSRRARARWYSRSVDIRTSLPSSHAYGMGAGCVPSPAPRAVKQGSVPKRRDTSAFSLPGDGRGRSLRPLLDG